MIDIPPLLGRIVIDLVAVLVLVFAIYRRGQASRDFSFACVMLNLVTFTLVWLMNQVTMDVGLGLGLFAIFGILRYRTEALGIRDLTYLFVAIGIAVVNGLDPERVSLAELAMLDGLCVLGAGLFDLFRRRARSPRVPVVYDKLELLTPSRRDELLGDLRTRLGLDCVSVDVRQVDLLRDTATIDVFLEPESSAP